MADESKFIFENKFLQTYMDYTENTESPKLYHVWSGLSAISAALGRRVFCNQLGKVYGNQFIWLVGPPAVKKSTAINIAGRLLDSSTKVRLAPDDTGGQRQGLIKALLGKVDEDIEGIFEEAQSADVGPSLAALLDEKKETALERLGQLEIDMRDRHSLYARASELSSFIGTNQGDLLTFLIKMWDGDSYTYQLRDTELVLADGLMSIIGGTTPTNISTGIPAAAMGQGFMSRVILVHADTKYKRIPWPHLSLENEQYLLECLSGVYNLLDGEMTFSKQAKDAVAAIYMEYHVEINDPRFLHYIDRRQQHVIKISMALAASNHRMEIHLGDVQIAHQILCVTEKGMPDALGEYGLSPLSATKQKLTEFLAQTTDAIPAKILWQIYQKDLKRPDFVSILGDLTNSGKIMLVNTLDGPAYVAKAGKKKKGGLDLFTELFPPGSLEREDMH